jgi:hypothetical protein
MCGKRLGEKLKEGKYEFGNRLTLHKARDALEWGGSEDLLQDLIVCLLVLEDAGTLNRMLSLRMDRGRSHFYLLSPTKRDACCEGRELSSTVLRWRKVATRTGFPKDIRSAIDHIVPVQSRTPSKDHNGSSLLIKKDNGGNAIPIDEFKLEFLAT